MADRATAREVRPVVVVDSFDEIRLYAAWIMSSNVDFPTCGVCCCALWYVFVDQLCLGEHFLIVVHAPADTTGVTIMIVRRPPVISDSWQHHPKSMNVVSSVNRNGRFAKTIIKTERKKERDCFVYFQMLTSNEHQS